MTTALKAAPNGPMNSTSATWTPTRIKALRKRMGMDQASFATEVGVTRQATISDWENGVKAPIPIFQRRLDELDTQAPQEAQPRRRRRQQGAE